MTKFIKIKKIMMNLNIMINLINKKFEISSQK